MSNSLRSLKRRQDRTSQELLPHQQKLPTGSVLTEPLRGTFTSFPLLSWIAVRDRDRIPLVMMVLALLDLESTTPAMRGTMSLELPLYVDTEAPTVAALARYGWTGAVWTLGDPPPQDNIELGEQLKGLLAQTTDSLKATLTFAPDPVTGGTQAQPVEVCRAKGRFLMPPLPEPAEPPKAELTQALRGLVLGFRSFYSAEPVS